MDANNLGTLKKLLSIYY